MQQLDYYDLHDYQMSDFDVGSEGLIDYAFSVAATEKYRYDVRPIDLRKSVVDQNRDYELYPGHKAMITRIRQHEDLIVTGDKKGDLKVMKFNFFKGDLRKAPPCITIKNVAS